MVGNPSGSFRRERPDVVNFRRFEEPGELRGLLVLRNDPLLAHAPRPIAKQKAIELREHVAALAHVADPAILDTWLAQAVVVRFRAF